LDWLDPASWTETATFADRLTSAEFSAAMAELARVFTPDWMAAAPQWHPVIRSEPWKTGRLALLDLGHAAAVVGVDDALLKRLQNAAEYLGAAAEIRAAFMLKRSGARLDREPLGKTSRLPEYRATWQSGAQAIVEVRAFKQSEIANAGERVALLVLQELHMLREVLSGTVVKIEWAKAILDAKNPLTDAAVSQATRAAVEAARGTLSASSEARVDIDRIGKLFLQVAPQGPDTPYHLEPGGFAPDDSTIYRRLRRQMKDKLDQISAHPTLPGVIIFDVEADGLAGNGFGLLERWVRTKPQLGVLIFVEREIVAQETRGLCLYGNVRLIFGPRAAETDNLAKSFELCDAKHIHCQALCTPSSPCPAKFGV
jgi:hypothetical protein